MIFGKKLDDFVRQTIGSCRNRQSDNIIERERFIIQSTKLFDRCMGVGKILEVSDILRIGSLRTKQLDLRFILRCNREMAIAGKIARA